MGSVGHLWMVLYSYMNVAWVVVILWSGGQNHTLPPVKCSRDGQTACTYLLTACAGGLGLKGGGDTKRIILLVAVWGWAQSEVLGSLLYACTLLMPLFSEVVGTLKKIRRWWRPTNAQRCEDTQTPPVVTQKMWTFCTHRWQECLNTLLMPTHTHAYSRSWAQRWWGN